MKATKINGISIYHSIWGDGDKSKVIFEEDGFNRVVLIGQKSIEGGSIGTVNPQTLSEVIVKALPKKNTRALVVLDW
jgi:hypothetical protein